MGRILAAVLAVALLALSLAAGLVSAQELPENLTNIKPAAPKPVENFGSKLIALLMFVAIIISAASGLIGIVKFSMGAPDAGKWLMRGLLALFAVIFFWALLKWFI